MTAGRSVNTLSQSWCTPLKYVTAIKQFWDNQIDLDPCSNEYSIVNAAVEYRLPDVDGLNSDWNYNHIYVNPPYGADRSRGTTIKNWLVKCVLAHENYQSEVIALIPVATNTSHWKTCIFGKADAICFLYDTRLKFLEHGVAKSKGAPMACCIVYWGNNVCKFRDIFKSFGAVVDISELKQIRIEHTLFENVKRSLQNCL